MPATPVPDPAELAAMMPFAVTLGMTVEAAAADRVTARLTWSPERCTAGGLLHGGVLMSLADTTGAICAFLNLPDGAGTATIESKTNFFRGVREGSVLATARPLHVGRSFIVVQTDLADDRGARVGQTTQTQAVLAPRG
jgi:1,4-dihydroxy-2-naphthoyl-CoA hydrolase